MRQFESFACNKIAVFGMRAKLLAKIFSVISLEFITLIGQCRGAWVWVLINRGTLSENQVQSNDNKKAMKERERSEKKK